MNIEYDTEENLKISHLPDLDQDLPDPDGAAAYSKIGRQMLRFQTPSYLVTVKLYPLCCSPHLTPPSPVKTNIDEDSQQESVEFEDPGGAHIPLGELQTQVVLFVKPEHVRMGLSLIVDCLPKVVNMNSCSIPFASGDTQLF